MTNKELERITYVNKSKKERKKEATAGRKDWTGLRPAVYKDKTKYNRKNFKKPTDND